MRLQAALDGGGLMDVGCYCVERACGCSAGEPERVSGAPGHRATASTCASPARSRSPGGVLGVFDCGLDMVDALAAGGGRRRDGSLFVPDPWHSRAGPASRCAGPAGPRSLTVPPADPYACELEDFAAAVRGERPHPFGRDDAVGQARTIAALYRSAEFGADAAP